MPSGISNSDFQVDLCLISMSLSFAISHCFSLGFGKSSKQLLASSKDKKLSITKCLKGDKKYSFSFAAFIIFLCFLLQNFSFVAAKIF